MPEKNTLPMVKPQIIPASKSSPKGFSTPRIGSGCIKFSAFSTPIYQSNFLNRRVICPSRCLKLSDQYSSTYSLALPWAGTLLGPTF